MPPRYTSYPAYSGGQWPQQLYPYQQYPPTYGWGYPQYPPYGGVPAIGSSFQMYPVSPRQQQRRRSLTPREEIQLHSLLGGRYRPTTVWDITQDLPAARHFTRGALDKIPEILLAESATEPAVNRMRIVSDAFPWDIDIVLARNEVVTVRHIFGAIYGTLQNPLEKEDWDGETPNVKRSFHRARCARLSKSAASFKLDSHIKKADILGEKTFFMGLKPVGPPEEPEEWLLKLGPPPRQGRR